MGRAIWSIFHEAALRGHSALADILVLNLAEAKVVTRKYNIKSYHMDDKSPQKGRDWGHVTHISLYNCGLSMPLSDVSDAVDGEPLLLACMMVDTTDVIR